MRASRDAFCLATKQWRTLTDYEQELDRVLAGQPLTMLRTYALPASRACDLLDVMRTHAFTVVRRNAKWEFLESSRTKRDKAGAVLAQETATALAGLTPREREVLLQLTQGAKNKEIAANLRISERTVEVYRARLLLKTKARNVQGLVRLAIEGGIDRQRRRTPKGH